MAAAVAAPRRGEGGGASAKILPRGSFVLPPDLDGTPTHHPPSTPLRLLPLPSITCAFLLAFALRLHHAARLTASAASSSPNTITLEPSGDPALCPRTLATPDESWSLAPLFGPCPVLAARRDRRLQPVRWPPVRRIVAGAVRSPALPPFPCTMPLRAKSRVPDPPRVISPSPTGSDNDGRDYSGPTTRSAVKKRRSTLEEHAEEEDHGGLRRSRTRSRSPLGGPRPTRATPGDSGHASGGAVANGHLAPPQPSTPTGWSWRDFSRSPSPLGLIPIHRHWRTFVHKHEVPRKALHVSIGFFIVWLYTHGTQASTVSPYLMAALIPIATTDWLRHRYRSVNRLYVGLLGALMRESEFSGWNGVIFYLLGAWIVLHFFPKDVGVMSVLLLSWCDTAASTFGRLWGRFTPRLRRGKSLAGSLAAFVVGVATSCFFYGWLVPTMGPMPGDDDFMFKGALSLPSAVKKAAGMSDHVAAITGPLALGVVSLWSGLVASASEVMDLFGWDDNLTIPVLSGLGIWGFLKVFG